MTEELQNYLPEYPEWASGYTAWLPERIIPVRRVGYTLVDLARRSLISPEAVQKFQQQTGLADFAWRLLWADTDGKPDAQSVAEMLMHAEGVVIFIHGWDGSGEIWEDLPTMLVKENPRLVALVPDVNGFGGSPFRNGNPSTEQCNPPAIMRSLELWLDILNLRPGVDGKPTRPFVFVGHSMGGATLFFLDETRWSPEKVGRIAAAPALLLNDRQRQRLYKTLGLGIRMSGWHHLIDRLAENVLAPRIIHGLAGGASKRVQAEHHRIYRSTPEGVISKTFSAMGQLSVRFQQESWPHFKVFLGDNDSLVGWEAMLRLLNAINFTTDQVQVVDGDHYFFSIGRRVVTHSNNRELLFNSIMDMCTELQQTPAAQEAPAK